MSGKLVNLRLLVGCPMAAALLLLPAWPAAGDGPVYPPPPEETAQASAPASVVEEAPVGPQDPSAFMPVAGSPETITGGPAQVVDMSRIATTPALLESDGRDRAHIQGEFEQVDFTTDGAWSRTPLGNSEHDTPMAEMDYSEMQTADPFAPAAPGGFVNRFDAQAYSGWIPPDTQMAVGPEYIVEAVNSGFMVYSKTGVLTRAYTNFETFVPLPSPWQTNDAFCYDPKVVYNRETNQFVMSIMGRDDTNLRSYVWILVSQTSNPNGAWWIYRIDFSFGTAGNEQWLDYASLGVDHWGLYLTGNSFGFPGVSAFQCRLLAISPSMLTGAAWSGLLWDDLRWPNNDYAFALQVAHPHTQHSGGGTFFVNTYSGSGNKICLWKLTGDRYSGQGLGTTSLTRVAINSKTYYAMNNTVDQAGSAWDIDAGDCRVQNAVYSQGKVYGTLTLNWDNNLLYSEIYVFALNTGDSTMAWDFALWNPDFNMFYPAITVEGTDSAPNWYVTSSMTQPAGGGNYGYVGAMSYTRDPATDTYSWVWDKVGAGPYSRWDGDFEGDGRNRWGDYSAAAYDWTCQNVWGAAEFATATNTWGTTIVQRTIDDEAPCTYLRVNDPNGGGAYAAGTTKTITWDRLNLPGGDSLYLRFLDDGDITAEYGPYATSTASYSWSVPNIPTTQGKFFVGSWNSATSTWTRYDYSDNNFTVVGRPDLGVSIFSTPTSAVQGESFFQYHSVRNDGPVTAGSFTVELRISTNDVCSSFDTLLATRTVSSLAPGAFNGTTPTITIPAGQPTGTNYLCMMIDTQSTVDEFDETNNTLARPITIIAGLIFADGFESGTWGQWSSATP